MKTKLLSALFLISLAINAYCQCPNPYWHPRQYSVNIPSSGYPANPYYQPRQYYLYAPANTCCMLNCNCTDPACMSDHCCFDCQKCCAAFGNIGAGCFEPFGEPFEPSHLCGPRYVPRRDYAPPYGAETGYFKVADNVTVVGEATPRHYMRRPMLHKRMVSMNRIYQEPDYYPMKRTYPAYHHRVKKYHYPMTRTYPICRHPVIKHQPKAILRPYTRVKHPVIQKKEYFVVHPHQVKIRRHPVLVR